MRLGASADGPSDGEAAARARRYGPDTLRVSPPVSAWRILAARLRSVVVLLAVAAAALSCATGDDPEAAAIAAVLVLNTALGLSSGRSRHVPACTPAGPRSGPAPAK